MNPELLAELEKYAMEMRMSQGTSGFTPQTMYAGQGPLGAPTPDPRQYGPPYRAPFGGDNMIQQDDVYSGQGGYSTSPGKMRSRYNDIATIPIGTDQAFYDAFRTYGDQNDKMSMREKILALLLKSAHEAASQQQYFGNIDNEVNYSKRSTK